MGECQAMHGTGAGDIEHAAVDFRAIVLVTDMRDNHLVELQAFGQMDTGNNSPRLQRGAA